MNMPAVDNQPKKGKKKRAPTLLLLPVLLLVVLCLLPIVYVVLRAQQAGWGQAVQLIFRERVYELLVNTLKMDFSVTILSVIIGVATAWFIERTSLLGQKRWNLHFSFPFAVPSFVSSYSWISFFPQVEGLSGAVLVLTLSSYPLVHLPVAAALRGMDPALEETSRSLGYGRFETFFR